MMFRIGRTERFDCQIEGEGYFTNRVARRIPLDAQIEIERPWWWGYYRHPSGAWSRLDLGLLGISWAWKLPNW